MTPRDQDADELPDVAPYRMHASEVQAAATGRDPALVTGGPVVDVTAPRDQRRAGMVAAGWGGPDAPQSTPAMLGGVVLTEARLREWEQAARASEQLGDVSIGWLCREARRALRGER